MALHITRTVDGHDLKVSVSSNNNLALVVFEVTEGRKNVYSTLYLDKDKVKQWNDSGEVTDVRMGSCTTVRLIKKQGREDYYMIDVDSFSSNPWIYFTKDTHQWISQRISEQNTN